jgi:polyisoprenoid-binding protein YceI
MRRVAMALAMAASAGAARGESWEARSGGDDRIVVHVLKRGLLAAFAHDHRFEVTGWRATLEMAEGDPATASVDVILEAGSLRDGEERLSEADRRKVDAQAAGPEVLDAPHHPSIEFRSTGFRPAAGDAPGRIAGTLRGDLVVRGRSAPLEVKVEASRQGGGWSVRGSARLRQSDLGIEPFSGFGGTIGVRDEVEVEIGMILRPRVP